MILISLKICILLNNTLWPQTIDLQYIAKV